MDEYVKEVEAIHEEGRYWVSVLGDFVNEAEAGEALREVQNRISYLERRKKEITKPMLEAKRKVDELFRPALKSLEQAKEGIKGYIEHTVKQVRILQREALAQGEPQKALQLTPVGITTRPVLRFRVLDVGLIPAEYWMLDERKVLESLKAGKDVAGVAAYYEETAVAR